MEQEKIFKFFANENKEYDEIEQTITHFITTEHIDRYGDIVRANGMEDEAYQKNPIVLLGHNHNSLPIGKSLWRKQVEKNGVKGILAKTKFAKTEEGTQIFNLWKEGFLNASSIGFIGKEFTPINEGKEFTKWELLEYSIVPIPANQEALRNAYSKGLITSEPIKKIFNEIIEVKETDKIIPMIEIIKTQMGNSEKLCLAMNEKINQILFYLENEKDEPIKQAEILGTKDISTIIANISSCEISKAKGKIENYN